MALDWVAYDPVIRYFHILSGIVWIGLLYFFNLVNLPLLKVQLSKPYSVNMAEKATANITLKALFFFRWGAVFTLVFGLLLVHVGAVGHGEATGADGADYGGYFMDRGFNGYMLLLGALFAVVMFINVWAVIWPNQQRILTNNKRIADGVAPEEKAKLEAENAPRVKNAVLASRTNTWLSVPMLAGMVFGAHGNGGTWSENVGPLAAVALVLVLMAIVSTSKPKA